MWKYINKLRFYNTQKACLILVCFCCSFSIVNSQDINILNGFTVNENINLDNKAVSIQHSVYVHENNYILGMHLQNKEALSKLISLGIKVNQQYAPNTFSAIIPSELSQLEMEKAGLDYLFYIPAENKIDNALKNMTNEEFEVLVNIDQAFESIATSNLKSIGITKDKIISKDYHVYTLKLNKASIQALASLPIVSYIAKKESNVELMDNRYFMHGTGKANTSSANSFGLTGAGVVVGVSDVGPVYNQHIDYQDRVTDLNNNTINASTYHGNHVSGIIGSAGIQDVMYTGIAPNASLLTAPVNGMHSSSYIDNYGMVISNHSYAAVSVNGSVYGGKYTSHPTLTDQKIQQNEQYMEIWSAGNVGGYGSLANGYNVAKNVLTVSGSKIDASGVSRNDDVSMGPTLDGRLKPEICANYKAISTDTENGYRSASGTSMSSPTAAGAMALMYEHYRNLNNGVDPKGATMKAIMCNSADDNGNVGPDYKWGFGNLNVNKALQVITDNHFYEASINQNEIESFQINAPSGLKQLKVMLYWNDKYGAPNCTSCLVNDLDIKLISPNGSDV
ncbi:MAG: S8 family serine peptidase, partial [Bacteroidota bacterium]